MHFFDFFFFKKESIYPTNNTVYKQKEQGTTIYIGEGGMN